MAKTARLTDGEENPETMNLPPLLNWVEDIHREIHQNPSDSVVSKIIDDNYSRSLIFDEDSTLQDFHAFKAFNKTFRQAYIALHVTDRKPVVFKRDPTGKGGVVGFASSWIFERKADKVQLGGDTIEMFEVTWEPKEASKPLGASRRLITKAFVAFGDPVPLARPRRTAAKRKAEASSTTVSGRVTKQKKMRSTAR